MLACFYIIDGVFKGLDDQVKEGTDLLLKLARRDNYGDPLIPKYFYIDKEYIETERAEVRLDFVI